MPPSKKVKVVPKEGVKDPKTLFWKDGFCGICGETKPFLQKHYVDRHTGKKKKEVRRGRGGRPSKLNIIPKEGEVDPETITRRHGTCQKCDIDPTELKTHYVKVHLKQSNQQKKVFVKVLNDGENWELDDVETYEGVCNLAPCKGNRLERLKAHYRKVHLKEEKECEDCGALVPIGNYSQHIKMHLNVKVNCDICGKEVTERNYQKHLKTHSGPASCSYCGKVSQSLLAFESHISRHHFGVQNVRSILLDKKEAEKYQKRQEFSKKCQKLGFRRRGVAILAHGTKLKKYQKKLNDPQDSVYKRKEKLKKKFLSLVNPPRNSLISYHAAFVSIWNLDWKTPELVFETVSSPNFDDITRYSSSYFHVDPKIARASQPKTRDYLNSKHDKGHLSAAANFRREHLVASTYYYSNIVPMCPNMNRGPRFHLEHSIREMAKEYETVDVFHFPLMEGRARTIGQLRVRVPDYVCTVAMVKKEEGLHLLGWKLPNIDAHFYSDTCLTDPFSLLKQAKIKVAFQRNDFAFISRDN